MLSSSQCMRTTKDLERVRFPRCPIRSLPPSTLALSSRSIEHSTYSSIWLTPAARPESLN